MTQNTAECTRSKNDPEPRIVNASNHPLSTKDIDRDALKVLSKLHKAGHAAYLVGGGVRDLYLGKTPKDFDISTDARPGQLRKLFRNSRTIGRRFRLVQVFFPGDKIIEVSTFRCRSEYDLNGEDAVLAANNTFGSLADDAFRRDLTINSLFFDIQNETIIDYTGGVADLDNEIIRIVGDPERRITRDPVRMMRAIRHAARSKFTIEETTWQAIVHNQEKLHLCPVSRIRDELMKDLRGGACAQWLELTLKSRLFFVPFPFYAEVIEESDDARKLLIHIFEVIDRLHNAKQYIPDSLLLGLLLIPWAQKNYPEMTGKIKSGDFYTLSRTIKNELGTILSHLNIKRATKENIASFISRLNLFAVNDKDGHWPKWLIKKSYYKESSQFYMIYREATGGKPVSGLKLSLPHKKKARPQKRSARKRGRGPSFAQKGQKGGVFGLRK